MKTSDDLDEESELVDLQIKKTEELWGFSGGDEERQKETMMKMKMKKETEKKRPAVMDFERRDR